MKKLMIAAVIVCAAAFAQASSWTWGVGGSAAQQIFKDMGSSTTLYSTTKDAVVYLFTTQIISQEKLLAGLRDGTIADLGSAGAIASRGITSDSKLAASTDTITYGTAGNNYNFYMAVMDKAGNLFLGSDMSKGAQETDTVSLSFTGVATATAKNLTDPADKTYAVGGTGWYAVAPEPTSGLLLLLGMGALALRRRRA